MRHRTTALCRILIGRGMDYQDLADLTGLSVRTLHNIGNGSNTTRSGRARVAAALGIEIWPRADSPAVPASQK